MVVEVRTEGLDLLNRDDGDWFLALTAEHRPDVLFTGPVYKMAGGDPTEEMSARTVAGYLDRVRRDHGSVVLLEAHSPHGTRSGKNVHRPLRPYGASLWLRWPEFGLHLAENGSLGNWRPGRDERDWPALLQRGGEWPWTPVTRERDELWARICEAGTVAGGPLSQRDLVAKLGSSNGAISRVIKEHQAEWDAFNASTDAEMLWEDE